MAAPDQECSAYSMTHTVCSKLNYSLYNEIIKELIMHTNRRIETHNSNIESNRRKISPISDKASFPSSDWLT